MMKTFAIVPVKNFENSKVRLSTVLSSEERVHLSSLMLEDTLSVLSDAGSLNQVIVVSPDWRAEEIAAKQGAKFLREQKENGVNAAIMLADRYCSEENADSSVVVPQDLPLLKAVDVDTACNMAENEEKCIVICPSLRYDGTNLLLRKPPSLIETCYDLESYQTHIKIAQDRGIPVKLFKAKGIMSDMDTPEDARQLSMEIGRGKTLEFIRSKVYGR